MWFGCTSIFLKIFHVYSKFIVSRKSPFVCNSDMIFNWYKCWLAIVICCDLIRPKGSISVLEYQIERLEINSFVYLFIFYFILLLTSVTNFYFINIHYWISSLKVLIKVVYHWSYGLNIFFEFDFFFFFY